MGLLLKLDESLDKDIAEWLAGIKGGFKTSEIKAAIRLYMGKPKEPSLIEIITELRAIKAQIDQIKVISSGESLAGDEPEKASKNVDDLLSRLEGGRVRMTIIVYTLYSILSKKVIDPFDFYEWFFFAPGHKAAWLVFFSFGAGFFVAIAAVTEKYVLLYPAVVCLTTIFTFGLKVAQQQTREVIKTVDVEKVITVEKEVLVRPGSKCGVVYILRRADGVLKFGKAQRLEDRLKAHRKDYQAEFDIVSSWIVPNMDIFEAMALSMTKVYFYSEAQRKELRQMTQSQLTQFILEFTELVHRGWTQ